MDGFTNHLSISICVWLLYSSDVNNKPPIRTLSLLGYLAAVYSWVTVIGILLIRLFVKQNDDLIGKIALIAVAISLSTFAWSRRANFRSLKNSRGQIPLTWYQAVIVTIAVVAYGITMMAICFRLFVQMQ